MKGVRGARREVLKYMKEFSFSGLTSVEAYEMFGVTRLASIIHELRKEHNIDTVMLEGHNRFGEHTSYAKYMYRGEKNGNENISN